MTRLLAEPLRVEVELREGVPATLREGQAAPRRVSRVCAFWRAEADWWRVPVSREYWKLLLGEDLLEVYRDRLTGLFWLSRYYD